MLRELATISLKNPAFSAMEGSSWAPLAMAIPLQLPAFLVAGRSFSH
jgi:hypothetical protein